MSDDYRQRYLRLRAGIKPRRSMMSQAGQTVVPKYRHHQPFQRTAWAPAGLWLRLVAFLIDLSVMASIVKILSMVLSNRSDLSLEMLSDFIYQFSLGLIGQNSLAGLLPVLATVVSWTLLLFMVGVIYYAFFESSPMQASPGKVLVGIHVITAYGYRCSTKDGLLRNIVKVFSAAAFMLGFLMVAFRKSGQAFHDSISNCYVVRRPKVWRGRYYAVAAFSVIFFAATVFLINLQSSDGDSSKLTFLERLKGLMAASDDTGAADAGREQAAAGSLGDPAEEFHDKQIGRISLNGKSFELLDAFVRLQPQISSDGINLRNLAEGTKQLEIALFAKKLTNADRGKLEKIPSFLKHGKRLRDKQPVAELLMFYDPAEPRCAVAGLQRGVLRLNPEQNSADISDPISVEIISNTDQTRRDFRLSSSCFELEPGKEYSLNAQGKRTVSGRSKQHVSWFVKFTRTIHAMRTLGSYSYVYAEHALALWDKRKSQLQIALYPVRLSKKEIAEIRKAKSLKKIANKQPDMLASMDISRVGSISKNGSAQIARVVTGMQQKMLKRNFVRNGYTLNIFRNPQGAIKFSGPKSKLRFDYEAGTAPPTLYGSLEPGSRIVGRFEGDWRHLSENGAFKLDWAVSFKATVLVID